jgi:hypothetical protein
MTTVIDTTAGWTCDTGASLIADATSPGRGRLPDLHAVIYVCEAHRADAEARIAAAGYRPDTNPAPPSHRWNPWPCGHITAYEAAAADGLAAACGRCRRTFDPADRRHDGAAEEMSAPGYCRGCVDRCHEAEADHRCPICTPARANQ